MVFVYVLISGEDDFYAEEMLISVASLRKYHPHDHVLLLTDKETINNLQDHRKDILNYVDEVKEVFIPENFSRVQRSRFLKTSIEIYVEKDFVFLDSDTVIIKELKFPKDRKPDIMAVYAAHGGKIDEVLYLDHFKKYYKARGMIYNRSDYPAKEYFNSGVLFCRKTEMTKLFFEEWHNSWLKSSTEYSWNQDQVDFCLSNIKLGKIVKPIKGIYNCQILYADSLKYIDKAKIIHYFSKSPHTAYYKFRNPDYLMNLRKRGIPDEFEVDIRESLKPYYNRMYRWSEIVPIPNDSFYIKTMKKLKWRMKNFISSLKHLRI